MQHEEVFHEHAGKAHLTHDQDGEMHHYRSGCPLGRPDWTSAAHSGPPMVATLAFRTGYDSIDWSSKPS